MFNILHRIVISFEGYDSELIPHRLYSFNAMAVNMFNTDELAFVGRWKSK